MAALSAEISALNNDRVVDLLKGKFFMEGGDASSRAPIFTVRENVAAMRKEFEGAGAGRDAIRFDRNTKVFYLGLTGVKPDRAKDLYGVLEDYGHGSAGEAAWKAERDEQVRLETATRRALQSEAVQSGAMVDLKTHKEGVAAAQLVDAGLDASTADVVARDFVRREQDYAARSEAEGFDMPDAQDVLQESYAEVSADIDAAFAQLEAAEGQEAVASADLDEARRQALVAYVNTSRLDVLDQNASVGVADGVADTLVVTAGGDGQVPAREYSMRFAHDSATAIAVGVEGEDQLFTANRAKSLELLNGYYEGFKRDHMSFDAMRDPTSAQAVKIVANDGDQRQTWKFGFEGAAIKAITCDGNEVSENTLVVAAANKGATLERVANRLGTTAEKPARVVLTVPPSERDEFERLKAEKGAVTRYDAKAQSGHGRPGGWYLVKGEAKDFEKWTGPEAHAKFVAEGNARYRNQVDLSNAAKTVAAEADGKPFAHFERGVMMHQKAEDAQKFIDGYTDNLGRQRRGLKEASADELRSLAENTSKSYMELDRKESVLRLEVMVKNSPSWRTRYQAMPGSHDEKIEALLPRTAADGKIGFRGLNHNQNRQQWHVNGQEASLEPNEKRTMQSLYRGFGWLRERYQEVAGRSLDFTLTGVKLSTAEARKEVASETTLAPTKPNEAARNRLAAQMLGGRDDGPGR